MRAHTKKLHIEKKIHQNDDEYISMEDIRKKVVQICDGKPEGAICLKALREKKGLTQIQVATLLGIEQPNLSAMERGLRPIGKKLAKKIAKEFNTDYRIFL